MGRTIYRFYCYRCMREHKSTESFLLERSDKKVKKIYCPGCRAWVPVGDTNLSSDRFRLMHINGWCVVDEDAKEERILFARLSRVKARQICDRLNKGKPL